MIIVADTNIIVSSLIKPFSDTGKILRLILENKVKLALDLRILIEYEEVLKRQEFKFNLNKIQSIINFFRKNGLHINAMPLENSLPDEDDNPFLEVAISAKADYLITGNTRHFPSKLCKNIKIATPAEFLKEFTI
ncbi:MAG: putative toxin-antitoxin system toxin component, PIN family [Actinobacteria bacterium]|nr:putative toxin-antitoxin system toxin component, PIN family [Actinomycetota bacterium]